MTRKEPIPKNSAKTNETNSWISSGSTSDRTPSDTPKILSATREYDGYFKIDKVVLDQPRFDGSGNRKVIRYVFDRGDSAAVLLHDPVLRKIILVRQFRLPPAIRRDDGWMLEIVAGSIQKDQNPSSVAHREIKEEVGIETPSPRFLMAFYLSPGASSEKCHLYELPIDSQGLRNRLCGESGTDEDIRVETFTLEEVNRLIRSGMIQDAKTIIAVSLLNTGLIEGWNGP